MWQPQPNIFPDSFSSCHSNSFCRSFVHNKCWIFLLEDRTVEFEIGTAAKMSQQSGKTNLWLGVSHPCARSEQKILYFQKHNCDKIDISNKRLSDDMPVMKISQAQEAVVSYAITWKAPFSFSGGSWIQCWSVRKKNCVVLLHMLSWI